MRNVLFIVLALTMVAVHGEPPPAAPAASSSRFYVVQSDGTARAEDPVRSGYAIGADTRLSGEAHPQRQVRVTGSAPARAEPNRPGSAAKPRRARNEAEALRCERVGLYYTRDGRCVVPAWHRVTDEHRVSH